MAVKEGEIALVHNVTRTKLSAVTKLDNLWFPDTITVPESFKGVTYANMKFECALTTSEMSAHYPGYKQYSLEFTKSSGKYFFLESKQATGGSLSYSYYYYTLDSETNTLKFSNCTGRFKQGVRNHLLYPVKVPSPSADYLISVLEQTETELEDFKGIFKCNKNTWNPLDVGYRIKPVKVLEGITYYDNEGFKTGTFGTPTTKAELKADYRNVLKSIGNYKPTSLASMYYNTNNSQIKDLPEVAFINTSEVTTLEKCFYVVYRVKTLDLSRWDTSKVENMAYLFSSSDFEEIYGIKNWKVSKVTTFERCFYQDEELLDIDLSKWTNKVCTTLKSMFYNSAKLKRFDLRGFTPVEGADTSYMFYGCTSAEYIDIRNFDLTSEANTTTSMFGSASTASSKIPENCLIICKDDTQKEFITTNYNWLTNIKTLSEYQAEGGV